MLAAGRTSRSRTSDLQIAAIAITHDLPLHTINVDDFHETYRRVKELDILERDTFFQALHELPDGSVQMYIRDPAGNLVECCWPDVTTLDRSRFPELRRLEDSVPQTDEARGATLYLDRTTA